MHVSAAIKVKQKSTKAAGKREKSDAPKTVAKSSKAVAKPTILKSPKAKLPELKRDSFRMPSGEFEALDKLKTRSKSLGVPARKSELLRAGLRALQGMDDHHLSVLLTQVKAL
jgi:hypothetical protein